MGNPPLSTEANLSMSSKEFYLRYYVGHKGKFGHEFLEFDLRPDGKLRYANNSHYKKDSMIRKEMYVGGAVINELVKIVEDSEVLYEDDEKWPMPNRNGRQELEIVLDDDHISFCTRKIGSMTEIDNSYNPEGLKIFYYLIQDVKCLVFSMVGLHFRIKPI